MNLLKKILNWLKSLFYGKEEGALKPEKSIEERVLEEYVDLGVMIVKATPTYTPLSENYKKLSDAIASFHDLTLVSHNLPDSLKKSAFDNLLRLSEHLKNMVSNYVVSSRDKKWLNEMVKALSDAEKAVRDMEDRWRESNNSEFMVSLELIKHIYRG